MGFGATIGQLNLNGQKVDRFSAGVAELELGSLVRSLFKLNGMKGLHITYYLPGLFSNF